MNIFTFNFSILVLQIENERKGLREYEKNYNKFNNSVINCCRSSWI